MTNPERIAVVTGSNRGLGYAIAKKLAQLDRTRAIITSRKESDGLAAKQQLAQDGLNVDYHALDIASEESVQQFAQWLQQTYGKVDILVNNAGVNPTGQPGEDSLLAVDLDTLRSTLETNVLAVLRMFQVVVPLMKAHNYGRIVNVSTEMASLVSLHNDYYPLAPSYRLSKVGLNGLTVLLAKELQGTNILINAYSPGWLKTDMGGEDAPFTAEEGAETALYLATLPEDGPQGQFFAEMRKLGGPIQLSW